MKGEMKRYSLKLATMEDFKDECLSVAYNKTMFLLRVVKVVVRKQLAIDLIYILLDGGLRICATQLHSFPCIRDIDKQAKILDKFQTGEAVMAKDLKRDDWIWVDLPMFINEKMVLKSEVTK